MLVSCVGFLLQWYSIFQLGSFGSSCPLNIYLCHARQGRRVSVMQVAPRLILIFHLIQFLLALLISMQRWWSQKYLIKLIKPEIVIKLNLFLLDFEQFGSNRFVFFQIPLETLEYWRNLLFWGSCLIRLLTLFPFSEGLLARELLAGISGRRDDWFMHSPGQRVKCP